MDFPSEENCNHEEGALFIYHDGSAIQCDDCGAKWIRTGDK